MDFDRIKLMDIGISQYGIISTSQISFLQEIRELCEKNSCQNFATTWACPPAVGTLSECNKKCLTYNQALVFNTIPELEPGTGIRTWYRNWKSRWGGELGAPGIWHLIPKLNENAMEDDKKFKIIDKFRNIMYKSTKYEIPC